jgi:hypothetical protein
MIQLSGTLDARTILRDGLATLATPYLGAPRSAARRAAAGGRR